MTERGSKMRINNGESGVRVKVMNKRKRKIITVFNYISNTPSYIWVSS